VDEGTSFLDILRIGSLVLLVIVLLVGAAALIQRVRAGRPS
jgi:hypothetical protein